MKDIAIEIIVIHIEILIFHLVFAAKENFLNNLNIVIEKNMSTIVDNFININRILFLPDYLNFVEDKIQVKEN